MDFIFSQNGVNLILPVPPKEFEIKMGNLNTVVNVEEIGEIVVVGKNKLNTITIETFWPSKDYSFCTYKDFLPPYAAMGTLQNFRATGLPIQFIITETPVNVPLIIENFNFKEQDGTRDVYFTLDLREFKYIPVKTQVATTAASRPAKPTPSGYTVKQGDTLWKIAQINYGDGNRWNEIFDKNRDKLKNPNSINTGQVLTL